MEIFNLHGDEWDRIEEREGRRSKDAWIGARLERSRRQFQAGDAAEVEYVRPGARTMWTSTAS